MNQPDQSLGSPNRRMHPDAMGAHMELLHRDVSEMKSILKELTSAMTHFARVEERMASTMAAQERAFKAMDGMDSRIGEIEKRLPESARTSAWVDRAVWAAAALFFMYLLTSQGVLRP